MNERMLELYRLSWIPQTAIDPSNNMPYETTCFSPEKFGELLIRKCADIALKKGMASPDTDFRTGSYVINQYLLTHFGVEE